MPLEQALHIKVEKELAEALRRLSAERSVSIGELVRSAVRRTYLAGIEGLSQRKAAALTAYEAGFVSLGKLADELGMDAVSLRTWLSSNGFPSGETFSASGRWCMAPVDANHASGQKCSSDGPPEEIHPWPPARRAKSRRSTKPSTA